MSEFLQSIQARREQRFFTGSISTPEALLQFIDEMGFCLFSYIPGVELPNMGMALCPEADRWGWKDSLPASRQVYYGAVFHPVPAWEARPGFVSLRMLAALYALAPILQFGGDRALMRRWVKISAEAIAIADTLESAGSLSTRELRAGTGLTGKANAGRFSRALHEAQAHFLVSKVGVTSNTRGNYGYVWSSFAQVFSEAARRGEQMTDADAAEAIIRQYVRTALAVPLARITEVLALDPRPFQAAAARLLERGELREEEDDGACFLTTVV